MTQTEAYNAREIAAASPAAMAHFTTEGRWLTYEHLLKIDEQLLKISAGEINRLIIELPVRHGKDCAHETLVATPNGYVQHGDLQPGDSVFAPNGNAVRVQALSEDYPASWLVRFADGAEIVTHGAHEWPVYSRSARRWRILETQHLAQLKLRYGAGPTARNLYQVAYAQPLTGRGDDLPMDAYTLGVWLGDGGADAPAINHNARDTYHLPYAEHRRYIHSDTGVVRTFYDALWADLRKTGVANNKHIPEAFLWASEASRWALLSGLIDTDGCVGADGRVRFVNCNYDLIEGVAHLVRSFGWRPSVHYQEPSTSTSGVVGKQRVWTVGFSPDCGMVPARLPRKARAATAQSRLRGIVAVEPVEPRPGRCIQVEGGEYLVGKELVPTHNSELVSHYMPAWYLGQHPDQQVMLTAYNDTFARAWGKKARNTLAAVGPQLFGVTVAGDSAASDWWYLANRTGVMVTAGIGGSVTGKGADLLIIDDPIKNAEEANSEGQRQKIWDWWLSTSSTRLQPGGKVILVMARWHEEDLAGMIKEHEDPTEPWTVLRLPALAEENDPMGRRPGEALCPEMFDVEALEKQKRKSAYWFAALYQQSPAPAEGLMFKRGHFRYWKVVDGEEGPIYELKDKTEDERETSRFVSAASCATFQTVDVAASEKTTADYTVVATWAATRNHELILLDLERQRFDALQVAQFLKRKNNEHGRPPMWIETFGAGRTPHKQLVRDGFPVREIKPEQGTRSDKLVRAHVAWALYEQHKIFHPIAAPWLGDFENELATFPSGKDDQVDTVSYAARMVPTINAVQRIRTPKHETITGSMNDMKF